MALFTQWGEKLDPKAPLQEYPRMQLQRDSYTNLNGLWEYQITEQNAEPDPAQWKKIIVPFALGSKLSGAQDQLLPGQALWYRKQFAYKPSILHTWLNFEGVDQYCTVYMNGIEVGSHAGGYSPFGFDISSMIKYQNSLMVRCFDDSDRGEYAYGKQMLEHSGMWYTPSSGIWQTVWLEDLGEHAVQDLKITPQLDEKKVIFDLAGNFTSARIIISDRGRAVHTGLVFDMHYEAQLDDVHVWTPDDPFLYDVYVQTEDDVIKSYFGMRKFSAGNDKEGVPRFCLNNRPLFFSGLLDQGYTPDGLMTFPDDEAMVYELKKIREMGFNMLRKHVKVECRRWYYHCDRLGILVMQDIPNGGVYDYKWQSVMPTIGFKQNDHENPRLGRTDARAQKTYYEELDGILDNLYNCTSLFAWCPFNEGWGQFDSQAVTDYIRNYDSTRLIDSASGWYDQGAGDFRSVHEYFVPLRVRPTKSGRIYILSEFGGYSYIEKGHSEAETLYGYRKFTDKLLLDEAVHKLYDSLIFRNIRKGLSGCIYTQVSDVEDECNGLFTADRKIIKIDEKKMRRMNDRLCRRIPK
ncbi:MAG: glycoside hydrolase family 2 TIM barrel-domain containing protein [Erysipelotrichaceae bacterium]|nr:glycoside hydrolase family 2 TIM barrel-domain containing protein [Erysipelotrichaceae bacterium]